MPIILLIQMLFSRWSWEKLRSLERQKWLKKVGLVLTSTFVANTFNFMLGRMHFYIVRLPCNAQNFPLSYPMTARTFLEKQGFINAETYSQRLEQEGV